MIKILVDSSADYQMEELKEKQLELIPLPIHLDGQEYIDGVNLERDEFYRLVAASKDFPTTSQPSPQEFLDIFQTVKKAGDELICILLSSELSGTYGCAVLAKEMADYEGIYLVDSKTAICAIKMLADYACRLRTEGVTAGEICTRLEELKGKVKVIAALDTLEYLSRGGRIGKAAAAIGEMANLKPVITLTKEGKVGIVGKCLGVNKAVNQLIKHLQEKPRNEAFPVYPIYSFGTTNCQRMEERVEKEGIWLSERLQIGATIGTHIGPEAFGMVYVEA